MTATSLLFSNQWKNQRRRGSRTNRTNTRYIPKELVFKEVLVRLPVKSLTRFKSVCKTWRSEIESRSFKDVHRLRHNRDYCDQILFSPFKSITQPMKSSSLLPSPPLSPSSLRDFIKLTSRPLDAVLPPEMTRLEWPSIESDDLARVVRPWKVKVRVLGPLRNGIYCVVAHLYRGEETLRRVSLTTGKIALCSPATRDYKFANPFPPEATSLLLDLSRQPCRVHYGFGPAQELDYKVIVVMSWGKIFTSFLSFVYCVKRGTWEKIVDYESGKRHLSKHKAISGLIVQGKVHYPEIIAKDFELCPQGFLNGSWHWMAMQRDYKFVVLSFDMVNEGFKLIGGPGGYYEGVHNDNDLYVKGGVSVLNHHLAAIYFTGRASSDRRSAIDVWMMMEYSVEESWTKIYTVNLTCNFFSRLVGISSSLTGVDYRIKRIFFEDLYQRMLSCDELGAIVHGVYDLSSSICWNTFGISAYRETFNGSSL